MAAQVVYSWDYIAPNTTVSDYIHGFSYHEALVFSATAGPAGGNPADLFVGVSVTQNEVYRHIDTTVARKVYVQNLDLINPCTVELSVIREPIGG